MVSLQFDSLEYLDRSPLGSTARQWWPLYCPLSHSVLTFECFDIRALDRLRYVCFPSICCCRRPIKYRSNPIHRYRFCVQLLALLLLLLLMMVAAVSLELSISSDCLYFLPFSTTSFPLIRTFSFISIQNVHFPLI